MTTLAATFETLNKKRMALIHEAAATGQAIDPEKIAEIQAQIQAAQQAQDLENEIRAAKASIEAEKRKTSNAEHLAELVQTVELKAEIADKLAQEIETDLASLRAKIGTWQAACGEVYAANGNVHHFASQTAQRITQKGVPNQDLEIVLMRKSDQFKRPLNSVGRTFTHQVR
ncbi:hypothetical protein [Halothiobacillus sp.]|uniref:hypothetical protein n=1 Tax=Halothiobacillus sp. TaxID=1891311 RepID=UPI002630A76D|nr:hypothetical protein [Halothiobacillus sp.]